MAHTSHLLSGAYVGLGRTAEEVNGVGVGHVPFERFEDVSLGLEDLKLGVGAVGAAEEVVCTRRHDFFDLYITRKASVRIFKQ